MNLAQRMFSLLAVLIFACGSVNAQYPLVRIQDIQTVPLDSLLLADTLQCTARAILDDSPLDTDTVRFVGRVMVKPGRMPFQAAVAHITLQDTANGSASALIVRAADSTVFNDSFIGIVDTGWVIEVVGRVEEFPGSAGGGMSVTSSTQIRMLAEPINVISSVTVPRPSPEEFQITDFVTGVQRPVTSKTIHFTTGEQWESVYGIIRNVRVKTRTQSGTTQRWTWSVEDAQGNEFDIDDLSPTFRGGPGSENFVPPPIGATIDYVRGIITQRACATSTGFLICPLYPGDLRVGASAPSISNVRRTIAVPASSDSVEVRAIIRDFDGNIVSAKVFYRVNGSAYDSLSMSRVATTDTFAVKVSPQAAEALVEFYVRATDDSGMVNQDPGSIQRQRYFYRVMNRPLRIQDVQFCPDSTGTSSFANLTSPTSGFVVTVSSVVTADTSDINGFGSEPRKTYIQNGGGPWSGIWISGMQTDALSRGDSVTVTGTVAEQFAVTRIQSVTSQVVHASGVPTPPPMVLSTAEIDLRAGGDSTAERWESVLLEFRDITITDDNADGPPSNFGEMLVSDGSGDMRVELQDGNHNLSNGALGTCCDTVAVGDTLRFLRGIMYFSFGNYKHVPRKSDDYDHVVAGVDVVPDLVPRAFTLEQNYPNPFNPTTRIRYAIPHAARVSLKVFNILGQHVATLVDQYQPPGVYNAEFNSAHRSSGIYFYRLQAERYVALRKMILVK